MTFKFKVQLLQNVCSQDNIILNFLQTEYMLIHKHESYFYELLAP